MVLVHMTDPDRDTHSICGVRLRAYDWDIPQTFRDRKTELCPECFRTYGHGIDLEIPAEASAG